MKISLSRTDFYESKPFALFEIKNFLPDNIYSDLYNSFPKEEYFKPGSDEYAIDLFHSSDEKFNLFLDSNLNWKDFYESMNSEKFIRSAYFFSLLPNIKSRGLAALKVWTTKENIPFYLKPFFRKVHVSFMFSRMNGVKRLAPHTDVPSKLISMVYYFCDKDWVNKAGGNTVFWKNIKNKEKWKNWENKHLPQKDHDDFKSDNVIWHETKFEGNKIIGFVKTDMSWHSVENVNTEAGSIRKAVNIFIRLRK